MKQRFKALLFDFDETLVPEYDVIDDVLLELGDEIAAEHGVRLDLKPSLYGASVNRMATMPALKEAGAKVLGKEPGPWYAFEIVWDDKSPVKELAPHLGDFRHCVWSDVFKDAGINDPALVIDLAERLPATGSERRLPYAESVEVLDQLRGNYRLALVTNGEPPVQAMKVKKSGIQHYFEHVILCGEHLPKPDPLPFNIAMERLGCKPGETAMIGNSLIMDIGGARNAGIFSVWVNRSGEQHPAETVPDATIKDLSELLDIL